MITLPLLVAYGTPGPEHMRGRETSMAGWIPWVVYAVGWLVACRVLARYFPDSMYAGLFMLGVIALVWPVLAVIGLFVLPVWLVTRGLDR